jgi:hypothetical protein
MIKQETNETSPHAHRWARSNCSRFPSTLSNPDHLAPHLLERLIGSGLDLGVRVTEHL